MRYLDMVIDLQFGSTGKGLIAGYMARRNRPDTVVTAWAPNAGHTFIDSNGRRFVHTMLANGIVSPELRRVMIGPGSVINPEALVEEMAACEDLLRDVDIIIHPHAAVVTDKHREEEAGSMTAIGSTKKGAGAAQIQRIRRNPADCNTADEALIDTPLNRYVTNTTRWIETMHDAVQVAQLEGAQGYSLSMYHGFYPYTTSRDVSRWQLLADAGIPHISDRHICAVGTARTYPIRVANRYAADGRQIGWSGPHYPDQQETSFPEIGQPVELTTVTRLPRRIFTYSSMQVRQAVTMCGIDEVFLNFTNYTTEAAVRQIMADINTTGARVRYLGHGPTETDVEDLDNE